MTLSFTLPDGLKIGSEVHKEVEIRDITAGDIIEANERSREVFLTPEGPMLMCPTDKIVRSMLCLIITKLGSLKMPLSPAEFNKLSAADFDFLAENTLKCGRSPTWTPWGEIISRYNDTLDLVLVAARVLHFPESDIFNMPFSRIIRYFGRLNKLKDKYKW